MNYSETRKEKLVVSGNLLYRICVCSFIVQLCLFTISTFEHIFTLSLIAWWFMKEWFLSYFFINKILLSSFPRIHRIVRNKAAEKAKHVHHQQQAQQCQQQGAGGPTGGSNGGSAVGNGGTNGTVTGSTGNNAEITGNVSVIIHSGTVHNQQQQQHPQTQLTPGGGEQRTGGYSINGILGIQHTDPNGNSIKRKRIDGEHTALFKHALYKRGVTNLSYNL